MKIILTLLLAIGLLLIGTQTAHADLVSVNTSDTIPTFSDDSTDGLIENIFPNDTDNFDLGTGIYYATKPYSYNGVGQWWIVIVLATVGGLILLSQGGSPFLLVMGLLIGNSAVWVFIPTDWQNTVIIMIVLTISILILHAIRPGRDR
jgi:hypothetical protein